MRKGTRRRPPWGWLEIVVLVQFLAPGLVFIPGTGRLRTASRVAAFAVPLAAWALIAAVGPRPVGRRFPAVPWLSFCAVWLLLSIANPGTNALMSGAAEAMLSIAVMAPAFWASRQGAIAPERIHRLVVLIFAVNGFSALLGIAQFYRPGTFNPPVIPVLLYSPETADSRFFEDAGGRKVLRPCGLTDTPGGAGLAGTYACVLGLGLALQPLNWWKRLGCLGVAVAGMGSIYLSHARVTLLIALGGVLVLAALLMLQRDFRKLLLLAGLASAVFFGGLAWAVREGGSAIAERFATLLVDKPADLYQSNRGYFLTATLLNFVPAYPLGAGLGRWGQPYMYFGQVRPLDDPRCAISVELQWTAWAVDGGIPLMLACVIALAATLIAGLRVAWSCPDRELRYLAALALALNLQIVALTFGSLPFAGPIGVVFWALAAAVDAADQHIMARRQSQIQLLRQQKRAAGRGPAPGEPRSRPAQAGS